MRERLVRRAAGALASVLAFGLGTPALAVAQSTATSEEVRGLASRAASDAAAARRLMEITTVDGRPVDIRGALAGASGEDLRSRLNALAAGPAGGPGASTGAGETLTSPGDEARRILDGSKFKPAPTVRPFRGILRRLGSWLSPIGEPLRRLWDNIASNTPGRIALVVAVIAFAALASLGLVRRSTRAGIARERGGRQRLGVQDPDALEREAEAAERAGRLDLAYRLRFRAGLIRLDRAGVIAYRASLTTGELKRSVPSARLVGLASAFEEIAYGGRPAQDGDLRTARSDWPLVLEEVGRR